MAMAVIKTRDADDLVLHGALELPCEDGHAQERSMTPEVLALVETGMQSSPRPKKGRSFSRAPYNLA